MFVSRWFQIESLYRFNAKFRPAWEPRFLVYPGAGDLPRIGVAALEAEAFIVWPGWSCAGWPRRLGGPVRGAAPRRLPADPASTARRR